MAKIIKICKIHGELNQSEISPRKNTIYSDCKKCKLKRSIDWRNNNPEKNKIYRHIANLKKSFGITLNQYEKLKEKQNNLCKICKQPEKSKNLSVDHCHKTNKIRGLLCHQCNTALGLFKDSQQLLQQAIKYLKASI